VRGRRPETVSSGVFGRRHRQRVASRRSEIQRPAPSSSSRR
jgi:hypothetical protein